MSIGKVLDVGPKLCVSCNMFFGNQALNCMCSVCFKKANSITGELAKQPVTALATQKVEVQKPETLQTNKSVCFKCAKKVGLLGIQCKCHYIFCNLHRMPEEHSCTVDYKQLGKEKLQKQAQKVAPRKLTEI